MSACSAACDVRESLDVCYVIACTVHYLNRAAVQRHRSTQVWDQHQAIHCQHVLSLSQEDGRPEGARRYISLFSIFIVTPYLNLHRRSPHAHLLGRSGHLPPHRRRRSHNPPMEPDFRHAHPDVCGAWLCCTRPCVRARQHAVRVLWWRPGGVFVGRSDRTDCQAV